MPDIKQTPPAFRLPSDDSIAAGSPLGSAALHAYRKPKAGGSAATARPAHAEAMPWGAAAAQSAHQLNAWQVSQNFSNDPVHAPTPKIAEASNAAEVRAHAAAVAAAQPSREGRSKPPLATDNLLEALLRPPLEGGGGETEQPTGDISVRSPAALCLC